MANVTLVNRTSAQEVPSADGFLSCLLQRPDQKVARINPDNLYDRLLRGIGHQHIDAMNDYFRRWEVDSKAQAVPYSFSMVHCKGCWCFLAKSITWVTLVSAISKV